MPVFLSYNHVVHLVGMEHAQREREASAPPGAVSCPSPPSSRSPGTPGSTSTAAPSRSCTQSYTWVESESDIWKQLTHKVVNTFNVRLCAISWLTTKTRHTHTRVICILLISKALAGSSRGSSALPWGHCWPTWSCYSMNISQVGSLHNVFLRFLLMKI